MRDLRIPAVATIIGAIGGGWLIHSFSAPEGGFQPTSEPPRNPKEERVSERPMSKRAQEPKGPHDPEHSDLLQDLTNRWQELTRTEQGEALLVKQHSLIREAVGLGPGEELLKFLDFLAKSGAGDLRLNLIAEAGNSIFTGSGAAEARDWLVSVEDAKLKESLCYLAGKHFTGPGLKEFIAAFHPDDHSQSAVLTGYCRNLAQADPSGAVDTFIKMRPSNVDFSGIVTVMNALPPQTDFPAISGTLPDDSKSIARRARAALLTSWAAVRPAEAAQYIISNSSLVFPDQMGGVIGKWAATSPEDASKWIEALSPGKPRDEGVSALARHWTAEDPRKAWEFAGKVGDFDKRVETATAVFKEWEKTDRETATRYWAELFPTTD